jgi:hypothetical protein
MVVTKTTNPSNQNTGASGTVLQGQGLGTADAHSTATYPATAGTSGTILTSNGTNIVNTTATYPSTATTGDIIFATGTNALGSLAAVAAHQVLASAGTGTAPAYTATPTVTSITFGAGSALSTFVQGTWTPNLQINGSNTGITYNNQNGYYVQVGNLVFIAVDINLSSKGSSTGNVTISNLPVTTGSTLGSGMAIGWFSGFTLASYTSMSLITNVSVTTAILYASGSAETPDVVTNSMISNSFRIIFTGCYSAA